MAAVFAGATPIDVNLIAANTKENAVSRYIDSMLITVIANERRHQIQRSYGGRPARSTGSRTRGSAVDRRIRFIRTARRSAAYAATGR